MGTSEKFCLKWNDFESNISIAFRDLREEKDFFDVTLACDDDNQVEAHKTILSACSPFFRQVLRRNPHQHPLLYLRGVKYKELLAVLDFMYQGEVNVAQDELNSFLSVAEDLRVKGLTNSESGVKTKSENSSKVRGREATSSESPGQPPTKKSRPSASVNSQSTRPITAISAPPPSQESGADDDIQEVVPVKSEPSGGSVVSDSGGGTNSRVQPSSNDYEDGSMMDPEVGIDESYADESYDYGNYEEGYDDSAMMDPNTGMPLAAGADGNKDLDEIIQGMMTRYESSIMWNCKSCTYQSVNRQHVANHIEAKHVKVPTMTCEYCGQVSKNRKSLKMHIFRMHKKKKSSSTGKSSSTVIEIGFSSLP